MTAEEQAAVRSIAEQHLVNAADVADAFIEGRRIPTLVLKTGFSVYHAEQDPAAILLGEIFHGEVYTGNGFYFPAPGDVVIDCGANIGVFALYLLSLERRIRIHCFEPSPSTFRRLEHNIAVNGLSDNVSVYSLALYSADTVMRLKPTASSGDRSFFERWNTLAGEPEEEVQCVTLARALELCPTQYVDLLKLDVEGAELDILEGAGAANFDWERIRRITLEFHEFLRPGCGQKIVDLLRAYGYTHIDFTQSPTIGIIKAARSAASSALSSRSTTRD